MSCCPTCGTPDHVWKALETRPTALNGIKPELVPDLVEAAKNAKKLLDAVYSISIREILESSELTDIIGLNPWCVNEGLAEMNDVHPIGDAGLGIVLKEVTNDDTEGKS